MKKSIIVLIAVVSFLNLNAQVSPFLEKGTSGLGINAGFETGHGYDGVFGVASYSFKGIVDFSACLNRSYFNKNEAMLTNPDATSFYYYGEVTWWAVREKVIEGIEANFGLLATLEGAKNQDYTFIGGSYEGYLGGLIGVHANINFNLPNRWVLQPKFIVYYGMGKDQYNYIISSANEPYSYAASYFGVSLAKKMENGNSIVASFDQGMSNYSSNNYYDFSIGYVFSLK